MVATKFKHTCNAPVPFFWLEAAQIVCANMKSINLDDELVLQDRQIWGEIERVCSQFGYDVHYWPENLLIMPVEEQSPSNEKTSFIQKDKNMMSH